MLLVVLITDFNTLFAYWVRRLSLKNQWVSGPKGQKSPGVYKVRKLSRFYYSVKTKSLQEFENFQKYVGS